MNTQTCFSYLREVLSNPSKRLRRILWSISILCAILTIVESCCIFYFKSISVDDTLQADYTAAVQDSSRMDDEIRAMQQAESDDNHIPDLYRVITNARPKGCSFLSISMESPTDEENGGLIRIYALSSDQLTFFQFTDALRDSHALRNVSISQIQQLSDKRLIAVITADNIKGGN